MNMNVGKLLKIEENVCVIARDRVVRLKFRVSDGNSGELLQFGDDLFYLHGGYGGAFPKVEQAMEGCRVGDRLNLSLAPDDGYGIHQPELVITVPAKAFDGEMPEIGEVVDGQLPDGRDMSFTVTSMDAEQITLDGNHPFSGKQLDFAFEVLEIRDSIEAERSAGFAFDCMFN